MSVTCIVAGCGSRGDRDSVNFFKIPTVLHHKFSTEKNELSGRRRALWLAAIKKEDLTESKIKFQRVCSKHFITGKPAALEDQNDPDWVPSRFIGQLQCVDKRRSDVERKHRLEKRRKLQDAQESANNTQIHIQEQEEEQEKGVSNQTDLSMKDLETKLEQLTFASKRIAYLKTKIENFPFGLMNEISNDDKWKYYTCFTYDIVSLVIFPVVESYIQSTSTTVLCPFDQLLLTLIKLRLDLRFQDLAYNFTISPTTAFTYFSNVIEVLFKRLKPFIIWPELPTNQKNAPFCSQESFRNKTTVIVDCFEVFIEKPRSLLTQQQCWSYYNHHHTIKFLVGITPQGTICYISEAWGGCASDKQIVEGSNFCDKLKPGDVVLADSGFYMKETIGVLGEKIVTPAFTKGKSQLHPIEIEETRQVRIHVEKSKNKLNKFHVIRNTVPVSMLKMCNNEQINMLDKIVLVCSAFVNLSPPIVPL